jgi:hypothetical protein
MIAPASEVKRDKNWNKMFSKGDGIVERAHFRLNITVTGGVSVLLDISAEFITE